MTHNWRLRVAFDHKLVVLQNAMMTMIIVLMIILMMTFLRTRNDDELGDNDDEDRTPSTHTLQSSPSRRDLPPNSLQPVWTELWQKNENHRSFALVSSGDHPICSKYFNKLCNISKYFKVDIRFVYNWLELQKGFQYWTAYQFLGQNLPSEIIVDS